MIKRCRVEELTAQYYQSVYLFCCAKLENPNDARDVTQEVFLVFVQKSATLDEEKILQWLISVANNKIHELRREQKKTRFLIHSPNISNYEVASEIDFECEAEGFLCRDEIESKIEWIKSKLEPKEQELFNYAYEQKLKNSEIAEKLSTSKEVVSVRKSRLKSKILTIIKMNFMLAAFIAVKLGFFK